MAAAGMGKMRTVAWMQVLILASGLTRAVCEKSNEEVVLEEKAESWNLVVVVTLLAVCIFATYLVVSSKIRQVEACLNTWSFDPRLGHPPACYVPVLFLEKWTRAFAIKKKQ
jgi:hypothetical protein